jgi:hypothetical protein
MKRRLTFAATFLGGLVGYFGWRLHTSPRLRSGLWCRFGFRHDVEREMTAVGTIYRCRRCKKASANLLEFLDPKSEDGHVSLDRPDQLERLEMQRMKAGVEGHSRRRAF